MAGDKGFWKYKAVLHVIINYRGWFGWWRYRDTQTIQIVDSDSFTGHSWGLVPTMATLDSRSTDHRSDLNIPRAVGTRLSFSLAAIAALLTAPPA
jgi:hypothetical protein